MVAQAYYESREKLEFPMVKSQVPLKKTTKKKKRA
jgi:hypothetical protein